MDKLSKIDQIPVDKWIKYIESNPIEGNIVIRFCFLWIRYNEYYNQIKDGRDRNKALQLSKDLKAQSIYAKLRVRALKEFEKIPRTDSDKPRKGIYKEYSSDLIVQFNDRNDSLRSFLETVYQIRCNLFHGVKGEPSPINVELILWAYKHLSTLLLKLKILE